MEWSEFGAAVGDLSQMLKSAIVLPFRRRAGSGAPHRRPQRAVPPASGTPRGLAVKVRGHLVLAAGTAPDEALVELVHLAGGRAARAVVVPAASYDFATAGERYRRYLRRFGMERTETVDISTRVRAEDPAAAARLAAADLLVIGGGSPDLLLGILRGTAAETAFQASLARGAVVALFGPATEAAGQWYLPAEEPHAEAPGRNLPPSGAGRHEPLPVPVPAPLRPGLGLLPGTLVAAAPVVGGRVAQIFAAALTMGVQALVLDERSALVVRPGWRGEVRAGTVLAVGGREPGGGSVEPSPVPPLGGVFTRVAPAGWQLDLAAHLVLPPGGREAPQPAGGRGG